MSGAAATSGSGSLLKPMTRSNGISATTASGASRCAYDSRGGACDPSAACSSSSFSRPPAPGVPAPPAPTSLPASAATPPAPAPGVATATDGSGPVRIAVLDVSWTVASPPPTWTSLGRPKDPEVEVEVDVEVGRTLPATWVIVAPAVPGRAVQMATDQASTDAAPPCCDTMSAPTPTRAPPMNPTARSPTGQRRAERQQQEDRADDRQRAADLAGDACRTGCWRRSGPTPSMGGRPDCRRSDHVARPLDPHPAGWGSRCPGRRSGR